MELNDLIALMAASVLATKRAEAPEGSNMSKDIADSVDIAHDIWIAVLEKDRKS